MGVMFKSNLHIVKEEFIADDVRFRGFIHDLKALKKYVEMNPSNYNRLTPIQKDEYDLAQHCSYAALDDYVWGTVRDKKGKLHVVCKCIQVKCHHFQKCRPDFNEKELEVLEENKKYASLLAHFDNPNKIGIDPLEKLKEEAKRKAEEEAKRKAEEEAKRKAEEEAKRKAEEEAKRKAEEEAKRKAEEEAKRNAEGEAKRKAEEEAKRNAEGEAETKIIVDDPQQYVIHLPQDARTIIDAGPGTGKTWTLIEKIKYMLNTFEVPADSISVLCFSRSAVEVVRNRLESAAGEGELPLDWRALDVRTFDSLATFLLAAVEKEAPNLLPVASSGKYSLERRSYDERICDAVQLLHRAAEQKIGLLDNYEHVFVDEIQDLVGVRAEFVLTLLKNLPRTSGFTLLGDPCQSLYDYITLNNSALMASAEFRQHLKDKFKDAECITFSHNYRQHRELIQLLAPYREGILANDESKCKLALSQISEKIPQSEIALTDLNTEDCDKLKNYAKHGKLGILTRTNGQASQISAWLRAAEISHYHQKPLGDNHLAGWIGKVLFSLPKGADVIDERDFTQIFKKIYGGLDSDQVQLYWRALVSVSQNYVSNHYDIEEILRGLLHYAKDKLLYQEPDKEDTDIVVSNIHRAKGSEFTNVLIIEDVFTGFKCLEDRETEESKLLEQKVRYVALTRAKNKIAKATWEPQYIYVMKDATRRCFRGNQKTWGSSRYMTHFEVGLPGDILDRSFATNDVLQRYIQENLIMGTRLVLIKEEEPQGTEPITYSLAVEENGDQMVLGHTSPHFGKQMEQAIKRIFNNYHSPILYKYYRNKFAEVYVDGLTTCISADGTGILGARRFGSMYVWNGLAISGFAKLVKDSY